MNVNADHQRGWAPIAISSLLIVLAALVGSSVLTVVVAQDTNIGWAIWHYPLIAVIPILTSVVLSAGAILLATNLSNTWWRASSGRGLVLVLSFLVIAYAIWAVSANWLFSTIFVALPEISGEAEDIFFRSWVDLEHSILVGAVFTAIALSATMMRSTTKHWIPITCAAAALAIWELGTLISTSI